jgi:membrane protease subunit (stomatin/prohibitin family)
MDPEDFFEPEVAITAVVTAAIFSPRARKLIRRGAVYGMAGLLIAGDAIASFANSVRQGAQEAGASTARTAQHAASQAKAEASAAETSAANVIHRKAPPRVSAEGTGG